MYVIKVTIKNTLVASSSCWVLPEDMISMSLTRAMRGGQRSLRAVLRSLDDSQPCDSLLQDTCRATGMRLQLYQAQGAADPCWFGTLPRSCCNKHVPRLKSRVFLAFKLLGRRCQGAWRASELLVEIAPRRGDAQCSAELPPMPAGTRWARAPAACGGGATSSVPVLPDAFSAVEHVACTWPIMRGR